MKKLKITINGEVKTFDLPENGEYKCEVAESYVPKKGDYVRVKSEESNILYWCKITDVTNTTADFKICVNSNLKISKKGFFNISENRIYTKITSEELKAKYAEADYDWDYETDTIKPIKCMPKDGDVVWFLSIYMKPVWFIFGKNNDYDKELFKKGNLFTTEEECQKLADHCMSYINNKKE